MTTSSRSSSMLSTTSWGRAEPVQVRGIVARLDVNEFNNGLVVNLGTCMVHKKSSGGRAVEASVGSIAAWPVPRQSSRNAVMHEMRLDCALLEDSE
eukprot:5337003-Heterocapsa_arctica.AAC.1